MTSVEIMDYGTNLQYERQSNEFYDYVFSHNVSTYTVRFAVIFYIVATLLTVIVDTSTCYDIVGRLLKCNKDMKFNDKPYT